VLVDETIRSPQNGIILNETLNKNASLLGSGMDAQKDVQPPKQQPMVYICGGKIMVALL
jgi:hypothetical protein